jgi:23S rRNA pseudouridine1911/1915/1917 synthase
VGDLTYGHNKSKLSAERQMLHAKELGFYHPVTEKWLEFEAELWSDMKDIIADLS